MASLIRADRCGQFIPTSNLATRVLKFADFKMTLASKLMACSATTLTKQCARFKRNTSSLLTVLLAGPRGKLWRPDGHRQSLLGRAVSPRGQLQLARTRPSANWLHHGRRLQFCARDRALSSAL